VAQHPEAGAVLHRWDSVVVDVVPAGGTAGVREPRRPLPDPVQEGAEPDQPNARPSPR
jgi:hypothetical protein